MKYLIKSITITFEFNKHIESYDMHPFVSAGGFEFTFGNEKVFVDGDFSDRTYTSNKKSDKVTVYISDIKDTKTDQKVYIDDKYLLDIKASEIFVYLESKDTSLTINKVIELSIEYANIYGDIARQYTCKNINNNILNIEKELVR